MAYADMVSGIFAVIWIIVFWFGLVKTIRLTVRGRRRTSRSKGIVVHVAMRGRNVVVPSPDVEFVDDHGIKRLLKSTFGTSWNQWSVDDANRVGLKLER
jgi:hypothetical protein